MYTYVASQHPGRKTCLFPKPASETLNKVVLPPVNIVGFKTTANREMSTTNPSYRNETPI
jgi:hypothetical protein